MLIVFNNQICFARGRMWFVELLIHTNLLTSKYSHCMNGWLYGSKEQKRRNTAIFEYLVLGLGTVLDRV